MLTLLRPYIALYKHYFWQIVIGLSLSILTLFASVFLLSLSGWFLASTAVVGVAGLYTFNYMLPAAGVRAAAITRTASRYVERLVDHNTTFKILAYLRTLAFRKILPLSANQLAQYQKADLLNRFIVDIDALDHLYLKLFSPIVTALVMILLLFVGLSYINLPIALIITIVLTITLLAIPVIFYHAGKQLGETLAKQQSEYRALLINYLQGQAELTLFNAQHRYRTKLDKLESDWLFHQQRQSTLMALSSALVVLIAGFLTLLVLWLITQYTLSPLVALFVFVCLASSEILAPIPGAFIFLGQVLTSATRTTTLFNQTPDIKFIEQGKTIDLSIAKLQFDDISFSYPNQPFAILSHFSLTINSGQHIGLIGKTGCGKSTLLNLVTRTWEANSGKILINDIPVDQLDEATLRQTIAVVPQVITIFSDTLKQNLLIGKRQASDQQLIDVLHQVELSKLLATDQGLNLPLGQGGRALSGGEIRRIGIARALLHNSPLILMDEPTESLDQQTEQQIIELIKQICKNKTLLMVTHRLTDSPLFDRVVEL
ncbi:cysteine/glutathione ABC transporter ATP-binding protein/permease CydC [Gilliamella sp. B14384H2]|uniref:heme ABC transporter ATP-binding protein/permease CydC n=1 Tax=unclassified Gilliamella TaxID=2685620 RepID=UPI0018DC9A01|nr:MULTISPECIES: cysteine/glutathione ABC transporter ATP-binding protein/permease CydC [unclassified Gilliamella]MBI0037070.1 cysteine/glutathione ABC transporter ATP-binding protein/permease CydC [Gilliamella sp. B14384G10]MBI0039276.1 cysteine/glutathione ABC transporter ATP-binding protein/permease CydC [Gilliamella sp. B14384G7]MBI0051065.1 cysteine/glutathione ABC transporter ATP-binding protein/permease CydC [Gilliamella sp. B14384G13]MBI0053357.1 cysteine/glutathione ABC transporter ATP